MRPSFTALAMIFLLNTPMPATAGTLPEGFVDVQSVAPDIECELRYLGSDNFVGRPVDGYAGNRCILSRPAAEALARAQEALRPYGLGLHVFDAFRPQRAVDHFVRWARDEDDTATKAAYYPDIDKDRFFPEGYIVERSGHSRGSTVDVTLVASGADGDPCRFLDMGTPFDFFGPESWPDSMAVAPQARANRLLLRRVMLDSGFLPYAQEWWHFTLADEPWPDRHFDFEIR